MEAGFQALIRDQLRTNFGQIIYYNIASMKRVKKSHRKLKAQKMFATKSVTKEVRRMMLVER